MTKSPLAYQTPAPPHAVTESLADDVSQRLDQHLEKEIRHTLTVEPACTTQEGTLPTRPRPILAVRLIGPAAEVNALTTALVAQLTAIYGERATCRTSTHHASHAGEIRVYLTLTPKGTT